MSRPPRKTTRFSRSNPIDERLFGQMEIAENGCWIYTGTYNRQNGYADLGYNGTKARVHRIAYELVVGPIPEGMHVDHVCHNEDPDCPAGVTCLHRRCINPDHLEAVAPRVNTLRSAKTAASKWARRTHCAKGHEFTEASTFITSRGYRSCRACKAAADRAYWAKRGAA